MAGHRRSISQTGCGVTSSGGQLLQDNWKFILRLTNDEEEAQELALYVLEKFEQFKPERGKFTAFIKMKLREFRQHYSDKGVVHHPCRKEAGGYISLDESHGDADGDADDEEVECNFHNLIAALPPPDVPAWLREVYYEETKSRRQYYAKPNADLGRCPEPVKLSRRRKRISPGAFRNELVATAAYAPRIKRRIYFAERAAGEQPLPKDTLWKKEVPDFLKGYWAKRLKEIVPLSEPARFKERTVIEASFDDDNGWAFARQQKSKWFRRSGRWHKERRYEDASVRAYLVRNGLALRLPHRRGERRSPFLTWLRRAETDELSAPRAIKKESHDLLWAALRVLCYKRAWPKGIPAVKLDPEDRFSPRERLLFQAKHVIVANGGKLPSRKAARPLKRDLQLTENTPDFSFITA